MRAENVTFSHLSELLQTRKISPFLFRLAFGDPPSPRGKGRLRCRLVLVPILGVHGWELWRIYRNVESYRFYRVQLTQPHSHGWLRSMYFTVLLQDDEGTVAANTHSIFATGKYQLGPIMEDYVNRTVTVAYNQETGCVVVIG